jgi:hemin uptake protein HemP
MTSAVERYAPAWAPKPRIERRAERPEHEAEELTRGGREALIRYRGQVYTLRITRQEKLLLTK